MKFFADPSSGRYNSVYPTAMAESAVLWMDAGACSRLAALGWGYAKRHKLVCIHGAEFTPATAAAAVMAFWEGRHIERAMSRGQPRLQVP